MKITLPPAALPREIAHAHRVDGASASGPDTASRTVCLDTETTGLSWRAGHRLVEIACVELISGATTGRTFHRYLNPERAVDRNAIAVHGLDNRFLRQHARFGEVADDFLAFTAGAKLVIHNASFDVGFLNHELHRCGKALLSEICPEIIDTLKLARQAFPGQTNTLDALCARFGIDTTSRTQHGALIDAQLLAQAYRSLTQHLENHAPAEAANMPRYNLRPRLSVSDSKALQARPMDLKP